MIAASRCFEIFLGCRGRFSFSSGSIPGFGNGFNASPNEGEVRDEVVNRLLASGENSPKFSWEICTYIGKLCRLGNLSEATRLLQSSRDKNVFLPDAYKVLLAAAGERNDIDLSCQVFKDLLVSSRPLSSTCYSNLARAFANTNDFAALPCFIKGISEFQKAQWL